MNAHSNGSTTDADTDQNEGDSSQKSANKAGDSNVSRKKRTSFLYFDGISVSFQHSNFCFLSLLWKGSIQLSMVLIRLIGGKFSLESI